jgi:hypothetical protein
MNPQRAKISAVGIRKGMVKEFGLHQTLSYHLQELEGALRAMDIAAESNNTLSMAKYVIKALDDVTELRRLVGDPDNLEKIAEIEKDLH